MAVAILTAIAYRIEVRSRSLQVGQANGSPIGTILEPRVALQHGHVTELAMCLASGLGFQRARAGIATPWIQRPAPSATVAEANIQFCDLIMQASLAACIENEGGSDAQAKC